MLPLFGFALMALNDHVLRVRWPSWLTGKLSDVGVVLGFPFLLTASWDWGCALADAIVRRASRGRWRIRVGLTPARLGVAMGLTALALGAINVSVAARDLYLVLLRHLDVLGLFGGFRYTVDPSDLLALAVLPLVAWWGRRYLKALARASPRGLW